MKTLWLFLLLSLTALSACISDDIKVVETENYVVVGDELPAFEIENTIAGGWNGLKSPDEFLGKKTLLVLFASYCGDCQRELPYVNYAWAELSDEGLNVVPISRQEDPETVRTYWDESGFGMPLYHDGDRSVFNLFANQTIPRLYLIGEDAKVVWMCIEDLGYGEFSETKGDEFNDLIKNKLNL